MVFEKYHLLGLVLMISLHFFSAFSAAPAGPAAPATTNNVEMDLLGSLSDSFSSNALSIVPSESATAAPDANVGSTASFAAPSSGSNNFDQAWLCSISSTFLVKAIRRVLKIMDLYRTWNSYSCELVYFMSSFPF